MGAARILVVLEGPHREKVAHGLRWAGKLAEKGLADVRVYFFGPSERLLADGDEEILELVRRLEELGVEVLACHGVAERGGYEEELKRRLGEERVTHVGRLIAERVAEGYVPITF